MATPREHLTLAAEMADEAYEVSDTDPAVSLAVAQTATAHALIARGLIELERLAWLGTAEVLLADRTVEDLPLPNPTNDESPTDAPAEPSDLTPEGT